MLAANAEKVGDHSDDGAPRTGISRVQVLQHFTYSRSQTFLAPLEALEHFNTACGAAALLPQSRNDFAGFIAKSLQTVTLLPQIRKHLAGSL